MNSRVKALLFALIVVGCFGGPFAPALAGGVDEVEGSRIFEYAADTEQAGSNVFGSAEAAIPVRLVEVDLAQLADHDRRSDHEQLQRPDAVDRIAKPIVIVAVVMFVGLVLLRLTARLVVRRRVQQAAAQT
jgi:hypothetical protein